jgi:cyclopropane fatty-acyl-phospholipid synthase-like methyltransferase
MKRYPELEWTPDLVAKFWSYESRFPERYFTHSQGDEILRQLRPHLTECDTILDYGCGAGHLLDKLLIRGCRAAGLDFSHESVAAVARRFAGRENFLGAFQPGDLHRAGRQFDAILAIEVIEHLYDDAFETLLSDVRRILKSGGVIIFTTPNDEQLENAHIFCPSCEKVFHRWQHVRSWSEAGLRQYLEERGFEVTDSFTTDFNEKRRRKKRRLVKKCKALWARLVYGARPNKKEPHLAVVCRLSATSGH